MLNESAREELWFERDSIRLHAVAAGPQDGPVVLLLHGFPEFWYSWRKQIGPLAAAGFRVIVPDQRGYNLSSKPPVVEAYQLENLVSDIVGVVDQLGQERVYLVGHDWGAVVAWGVALFHPRRLHKLGILNVPHPLVMMRAARHNPRQMLRSWYGLFFQLPWLPEQVFSAANFKLGTSSLLLTSRDGTFTLDDLAHYREAWSPPGAITAMLNWYRALFRYPPTIPRSAGESGDPHLVGTPRCVSFARAGGRERALLRLSRTHVLPPSEPLDPAGGAREGEPGADRVLPHVTLAGRTWRSVTQLRLRNFDSSRSSSKYSHTSVTSSAKPLYHSMYLGAFQRAPCSIRSKSSTRFRRPRPPPPG